MKLSSATLSYLAFLLLSATPSKGLGERHSVSPQGTPNYYENTQQTRFSLGAENKKQPTYKTNPLLVRLQEGHGSKYIDLTASGSDLEVKPKKRSDDLNAVEGINHYSHTIEINDKVALLNRALRFLADQVTIYQDELGSRAKPLADPYLEQKKDYVYSFLEATIGHDYEITPEVQMEFLKNIFRFVHDGSKSTWKNLFADKKFTQNLKVQLRKVLDLREGASHPYMKLNIPSHTIEEVGELYNYVDIADLSLETILHLLMRAPVDVKGVRIDTKPSAIWFDFRSLAIKLIGIEAVEMILENHDPSTPMSHFRGHGFMSNLYHYAPQLHNFPQVRQKDGDPSVFTVVDLVLKSGEQEEVETLINHNILLYNTRKIAGPHGLELACVHNPQRLLNMNSKIKEGSNIYERVSSLLKVVPARCRVGNLDEIHEITSFHYGNIVTEERRKWVASYKLQRTPETNTLEKLSHAYNQYLAMGLTGPRPEYFCRESHDMLKNDQNDKSAKIFDIVNNIYVNLREAHNSICSGKGHITHEVALELRALANNRENLEAFKKAIDEEYMEEMLSQLVETYFLSDAPTEMVIAFVRHRDFLEVMNSESMPHIKRVEILKALIQPLASSDGLDTLIKLAAITEFFFNRHAFDVEEDFEAGENSSIFENDMPNPFDSASEESKLVGHVTDDSQGMHKHDHVRTASRKSLDVSAEKEDLELEKEVKKLLRDITLKGRSGQISELLEKQSLIVIFKILRERQLSIERVGEIIDYIIRHPQGFYFINFAFLSQKFEEIRESITRYYNSGAKEARIVSSVLYTSLNLRNTHEEMLELYESHLERDVSSILIEQLKGSLEQEFMIEGQDLDQICSYFTLMKLPEPPRF